MILMLNFNQKEPRFKALCFEKLWKMVGTVKEPKNTV